MRLFMQLVPWVSLAGFDCDWLERSDEGAISLEFLHLHTSRPHRRPTTKTAAEPPDLNLRSHYCDWSRMLPFMHLKVSQ
ncbi:hypothetical protein GGR56DRAFT_620718 [Xylariaceae sp. FL0804]|nr:hypothetical protein GGR56DRAFT_620718 [Xylariaceae sp. FL0804]